MSAHLAGHSLGRVLSMASTQARITRVATILASGSGGEALRPHFAATMAGDDALPRGNSHNDLSNFCRLARHAAVAMTWDAFIAMIEDYKEQYLIQNSSASLREERNHKKLVNQLLRPIVVSTDYRRAMDSLRVLRNCLMHGLGYVDREIDGWAQGYEDGELEVPSIASLTWQSMDGSHLLRPVPYMPDISSVSATGVAFRRSFESSSGPEVRFDIELTQPECEGLLRLIYSLAWMFAVAVSRAGLKEPEFLMSSIPAEPSSHDECQHSQIQLSRPTDSSSVAPTRMKLDATGSALSANTLIKP